ESGLILCDTGLGFRTDRGELLLHANIRKLGFEASDVRYVLMAHLQKDHKSGMVDGTRIAFPEAEYTVQRCEWQYAYSGESSSYDTAVLDVVQRSGNLTLVEGECSIKRTITYELNEGHKPYHHAFHIPAGGEHIFF